MYFIIISKLIVFYKILFRIVRYLMLLEFIKIKRYESNAVKKKKKFFLETK